MKVRAFNIDWDTDEEKIDLPQEVFVEVEDEEEISDAVSDKVGFCLFSLQYEFI